MITVDDNQIGTVLFGKTRRALLSLLFGRPDESFHLRQLVRLSGTGLGPAQRDLAKLAGAGIVSREQQGSQVTYRANQLSPVFAEMKALIVKTCGLAEVLQAAMTPLKDRIDLAFVFGSYARGLQHSASDIDLLVISREVEFSEAVAALRAAQQQLGREINPMLYRPAEFRRKIAAKHHFLMRVLESPKIFLIGDEHELGRLAKERVANRASAQR
jgi:uncharacterized protein